MILQYNKNAPLKMRFLFVPIKNKSSKLCFNCAYLFIRKYAYTKMGRIVVNKHFDVKSNITPESFAHKGEIIISNQVGFEGIFIKNNNGEI